MTTPTSTPDTNRPAADATQPAPGWIQTLALCFGVWLHAGDSLMTATVMPAAIGDIGGAAFVYWALALYELGSIVAGAATGLLALRWGLIRAMVLASLIYAFGCAVSGLAPDMATLLAGRLLQGLGGGWMMALAYVGVTVLYPAERWPRIFGIQSAVWGVSAMVGPAVGALFAAAGMWRGAFWAFALQALLLAAVVPWVLPRRQPASLQASVPWPALTLIVLGVLAVLMAGVQASLAAGAAWIVGGVLVLRFALRKDSTRSDRLLPRAPLDPFSPWGPGLLMVLLLSMSTVPLFVYGPLIMAAVYDAPPTVFAAILAAESVAWSVVAVATARATPRYEPLLIRSGAVAIVLGVVGLAAFMPSGSLGLVAAAAILQGSGFGACWGFVIRRIVGRVAPDDHERASSAVPTMQILGYAMGAAAAGLVANALGMGDAMSADTGRRIGFWIFASFLPLCAVGLWAAWRLARPVAEDPDKELGQAGQPQEL
ncbi:MAG: MFS transporter [Rhodocyclaceae bacterium]